MVDVEKFSDVEIQSALSTAIMELGFSSKAIHRSPYDFSAVRSEEVRLKLAQSLDVEKHTACSCLDQKIKREAEETLLDRSAAYAVERQAGWFSLFLKEER